MKSRRIVWNVLILSALVPFMLAGKSKPGSELMFNPQPEPPAMLKNPVQPIKPAPPSTPQVHLPAVQAAPPASPPVMRRTAPAPGQLPGSEKMGVDPQPFNPAPDPNKPGQAKGFDVFKPGGDAGEKGIIIVNGKSFVPVPEGTSFGPGEAGEKGIIIINGKSFMPAPQGIIVQNPGQGAAQTAK